MTDHTDLIARLRDGMTLEGFGCACEPTFQCGTCKARDTVRKVFGNSIDEAADALEAQAARIAELEGALRQLMTAYNTGVQFSMQGDLSQEAKNRAWSAARTTLEKP